MNTELQIGPSFELGEIHKLISASARDFARQYIAPYVMDWDEQQFFPKELLRQAGEMGFMGILVPETYGGAGLVYFEYTAIIE